MSVVVGVFLVLFGLFLLLACVVVDHENQIEVREKQQNYERARALELEQQAWHKHVEKQHAEMAARGEFQHSIPDIDHFGQPKDVRFLNDNAQKPRLTAPRSMPIGQITDWDCVGECRPALPELPAPKE
jgi:hypothetical protein